MHIALYQPQIAPNTGNIIRLCANTGAQLHLIHPLGFTWDDRRLRRAGLDYAEYASILHHDHWAAFRAATKGHNLWALTTKGERSLYNARIQSEDILLFGSETAGLPAHIHQEIVFSQKIRLPMQPQSRSLNLSNAVAVVLYEAIRQNLPDETAIFL
ncbi:MAG: tRNA (uridine(34)/cytosine(34)/5-carboxymethylaminomethyluridine(34)-2'-O)-methyltransferase TrmL [Cardiobacteriaceae bacterium]|nr:tRNA (uridine(34)/cytosine(34)/5-carboxymethylaminomethyluridine(34)-2'-O)-methyltransferase TrmL [Cardiobacteriaceae bacterium]